MKYLRLILPLSLVAFLASFSVALADSCPCGCSKGACMSCSATPVDVTIAKATEKTAKLTVDSKSCTVPICFADGASWDSVKDNYSVAPCTVSALKAGKLALRIESDGDASFVKK